MFYNTCTIQIGCDNMSEKELLYVEDALSHLEYFKRHLCINKECLTEEKEVSLLKKIDKKVDQMYQTFYNLLKGE